MQAEGLVEADGLSDRALLRQYVERRSEAAFSRLVRRHLSLVYATCRREVGDPEAAEEVAQAVFLLLARKAPGLRAEAGLAGWLFQTARFAAKNALRREARRQRRERRAAEIMGEEQAQADGFWRQVEPHLNDALASLGAADREAVLLRFFEGQSLAEVGARLGLSENTARMRVARAVEKMRRHLGREGVTLGGVALTALLTDRAAPAAPTSCLAAALTLAPVPGVLAPPPGPAGVHLYQFTQGVWKAMWIKTATTTTLIAAAFVGAVAVPLVVASVPRARPANVPHSRSSDRATVAAVQPAPVLAAPAILSRKQLPGHQAVWQAVAHIKALRQVREAAGTAPEPIPTLAAALGQAKPPEGGIALAVGAEKVGLLEGNAPTHKDASLEQVGFAYGRLLQRFGAVSALAPPTVTVLNANPGQGNPYADIPAADAFTLLTAGLTPGQMGMLTSVRGLGLDDLSGDYQRGLFLACIPNRTLKVIPRPTAEEVPISPGAVRDVSDELFQARMRLGQAVQFEMPSKEGSGGIMPKFVAPGAPPVYDYFDRNAGLFSQNEVDGVQVRAEVPNTPKAGQLGFKAAAFRVPVPLAGLKTVSDLIRRVGSVTRTEMYADRRYEGRAVTVAGASASAPAGDLLRALALCLAGTYRKVGPAYVLTDDVVGLGTRRRILGEFQQDNAARRREPLQKAEDYLEANHTLRDLTLDAFGDPLIPTPEQMAKRDRNTLWPGAIMGVSLPLDQLTAAQQAAVRREADWLEQVRRDHPEQRPIEADLSRKITLLAQPSVQLLVPGLDGPIDTDLGQWVALRFQDTSRFRAPRHAPPPAQAVLPTPDVSGDLADLLKPIPRRAVAAHPKTVAEVDALVARMKRLGLNQLWLDVFSDGVARIPDTPLSPAGQPDLLAEALKATKGTGISVFPTLDLLAWGKKAPEADTDLTLLGETSAQSEAHRVARETVLAAAEAWDPPPPASAQVMVSPLIPDVQRSLLALVRAVASRPGIGGLVWRETTPPGYDPTKNPSARMTPRTTLGYTEAARLAFLRREHIDPIDLDLGGAGDSAERADTSMPGFDSPADNGMGEKWDEFRAEGETAFLRALYAAARPAGGKTGASARILVRQRRDHGGTAWYGSWDSPKAPFPTRRNSLDDYTGGDFPQDQDEATQAKAQSQVALLRLPLTGSLDTGSIASEWRSALEDLGRTRKWDGFVLEVPSGTGIDTPAPPKTASASPTSAPTAD